ncbi:MAG TPA: acetate--CoA ligase family protein, partial [Noviherbaspirillum sp.]|nr:acetate--CoA ligase family protein [Noviherbaspirillum sp.]
VECILGAHRDPTFGPVVMFGMGGVNVELLKDVSFRLAPIGIDEAHAMIAECRSAPLLDGYRGAPLADKEALAAAIVRLSELAATCGDSLESIDINPFAVLPQGRGALALDAVVIGRGAEAADPARLA